MPYIELKNINKVFNPNSNREHHALKNINLVINKGDFITIIGGNGAGKSTLFNAISGVFPLDSGSISINDVEISSTKEFERAKYISRVFQNPLDNTAPRMTVAENMALALNRGERRTLKFSKNKDNIALFENLLKNLNLGLEQKLNTEMGVLSGGQRQRISIARAMLKNAPIVILDEATSYIDPENEALIQNALANLVKGKTLIIIAHRLKTIVDADRIFVIKDGKLNSYGNHEELLKSSELYKEMYAASIRGDENA